MRLLQIETENVLGLPDGSYPFAKRAHDALAGATVITGPSGAGKTSLLAAVVFGREALAGYGPPEKPEKLLRIGATKGSLRIVFELAPAPQGGAAEDAEVSLAEVEERKAELTIELSQGATAPTVSKPLRKLFGRFGEPSAFGALEYFPDNRGLEPSGSRTVLDQEKRLRPGRARQKYAGLVPWLQTLAAKSAVEPDALARMRSALKHLSPGLELLGLEPSEIPELIFTIGGTSIPMSRLSSSQAQAVLFAGTLVRFGLETGLVLVDQPELHHSTDDHARFVRGLAEVARDAQLIIATGSSSVASAVRSSQLLHLQRVAASPAPSAAHVILEPAPEKPTSGPSALQPLRVVEALKPAAEVAPPAHHAQMPEREANHSTPSYLQQQARAPAPYIPVAEAPAPYTPVAQPPAPYIPIAEAPAQSPVAAAPPPSPARVVIRPYEPPSTTPAHSAHAAHTTGTEEIDTSAFRTRKPLSAEDAAALERMKQGAAAGASGDATAFLNPIAPAPSSANQLPFRPGTPSSPSQPAAPASSPRPAVQSGFTMAGSSGARPSMPFMRAGAPNPESIPPGWNIQRYAALCIDLHASGIPEERVLAMAQITRDQRIGLDDYWQARMTQDPSLRAEWQAHADRRVAEVRGRR